MGQIPELGQLRATEKEWIQQSAERKLPYLCEGLQGILGTNPRYHFTTEGFTFHPATKEARANFLGNLPSRQWHVEDRAEEGMEVNTWYLLNIQTNGLYPNSCVATMPEGVSADLLRSHPIFFLESFKRLVSKFAKHSIPYKQKLVYGTAGYISHVRGGVVVLGEQVPVVQKGHFERSTVNFANLLRAGTHHTPLGATPEDILGILRFNITQPVHWRQNALLVDPHTLTHEVLTGICQSLIEQSGYIQDESVNRVSLQRIASLMLSLCTKTPAKQETSLTLF